MRNSSRFRSLLLASCLVPLALGACSKEKKEEAAKAPGATDDAPAKVADDKAEPAAAPVVDKRKASDTAAALAYLPDSCAVAVHINLADGFKNPAMNKAFLPKLKSAFDAAKKDKENMAAFFDSTGLDPFSDFHEMGLCLSSIPEGGADPMGMGVVTGTAKPGLLTALLATSKKADKFTATKLGAVPAVERDGVVIAQLDDGTLVAGNDRAMLEKAISKSSGQAEAFGMIGSATLRVSVPTSTAKTGFSMPGSPFAKFSEKISGHSSFSADLKSRTLTLSIGTSNAESATELAGMAKLMLGQVPKSEGKSIEAQAMAALSAADVKGVGNAMVGVITFEEATLTQGLEMMTSQID